MKTLSDGSPSTLKTYRAIAAVLGGEDCRAVKFFDEKISESPNGENQEVLKDETQVLLLIVSMLD